MGVIFTETSHDFELILDRFDTAHGYRYRATIRDPRDHIVMVKVFDREGVASVWGLGMLHLKATNHAATQVDSRVHSYEIDGAIIQVSKCLDGEPRAPVTAPVFGDQGKTCRWGKEYYAPCSHL